MQLGLNVETGEVGAIWPWAPPCFANSSLSLYADSITAFAEGLPYDADLVEKLQVDPTWLLTGKTSQKQINNNTALKIGIIADKLPEK